jgi:KDO2-lipid IV(A) lauroyltransferase
MIARLAVFLMWLLHFLPLPVLTVLGNALGIALWVLSAERRRVASINLRLCFPEMGESERAALVRAHFCVFARCFLERSILWWSSRERIQRLTHVAGLEHLQTVQGGPVIVLAPHFVALDVGGSWMTQYVNLVSVYSNQKNPLFHKLLLSGRSRFNEPRLYSRQQGLRPIVKAMREGLPFYYLPDQDLATKDGVFVPFFGVQAATLTTVSRLAAMTGAKVVPCISRVLPGGRGYEVRFYPAWENYPTDDIVADTRRVNAFIEDRVREMPEQYFWLHKRFKTRPEGEERFY